MDREWIYPEARILVFAKAPISGQVKTRLVPEITPDRAADLHRKLVWHTLEKAVNSKLCPVELWCAPDVDHSFFNHCAARFGVDLFAQPEGDLGDRMHSALQDANTRGKLLVLIGTDCPMLNANDLRSALQALREGQDAVLGPAEDGGYVLIGMRRTDSVAFQAMPWGTDRVAEITRGRFNRLNWLWSELRCFWDVDRPEDLRRLYAAGLADTGASG